MSARAEIRVVDDPCQLVADTLAEVAAAGGQIVLTGGSTPRGAYELAAGAGVDWSRATLWYGDERCVGPDDQRSNHGMVRTALLERIEGSPPRVFRIHGEMGPDDGATAYERDLHDCFGAGMPEFDLLLLGLGPDGHCASLFPNRPELDETERLVAGVEEAGLEPFVPRVSFTLPLINAAQRVVFLVAGADKAQAVARAFVGEPGPHTPASLVAPSSQHLVVVLDRAAAGELES